jgi:hypothetical protein
MGIKIKKETNADTRTTTENITKEQLLDATISHIRDVEEGCKFVSKKILDVGKFHDYTKIALIDKFYEDFSTRAKGDLFKQLGWFEQHLKERHHLNDRVPKDVNLIDVIEMIVDCCMAGMARTGMMNDIKIDSEILQMAVKNTAELILNEIEVID